MIKSLGILIGGIFVGAVGAEIVHKKYPDAFNKLYKQTNKLYEKTTELASGVKEAFKQGYQNATQPQKATVAGA